MRLSEKTLELNFCHQFGSCISKNLIWFGLTQRQEAKAGFDACTRLGGKLLILQFKATTEIRFNNSRRFHAPHDQMQALRSRCTNQRGIYYVFPLIGTTSELINNPCILSHTWFLDVLLLPNPIPLPITWKGPVRKNKMHYIDVEPPDAFIHSETFKVTLLSSEKLLRGIRKEEIGIKPDDDLLNLPELTRKNILAVILY